MADSGQHRYGNVTRLFHWVIALMVFGTIPVGLAMTSQGFESIGDALYVAHKGIGSILLVLVAARVLWRLTHPAPPFPSHMPELEKRLASLTHTALYVLLVVMVISGYVRTVGDNFPIELLELLGVPPLIPHMPGTARVMGVLHKFTAFALTALIAVHITAAMQHSLILRDGLMSRIWPPVGGGPVDADEGSATPGSSDEGAG